MSVQLDEVNGPFKEEGNQVNVIQQKIPVTVGKGSLFFEILLWVLGIIPGIVFLFMKIGAQNHFERLQQQIQASSSQIDNFLIQKDTILRNCAKLLDKSIDLDKETMVKIAEARGGNRLSDEDRNEVYAKLDSVQNAINVAFENYPNLEAHHTIQEAMDKADYLSREITAARELYNDKILQWNTDIFKWPTNQIVAAKNKYTTRIPFSASQEVKKRADEETYF